MTNKKILVIGAGVAQVAAIVRAREIGYHVFASDVSPEAIGLKAAHEGRVIDVKDIEGNLDWAREIKISGVLSYASDVSLPTVLAIRQDLGLPGLSRVPMEVSLNKAEQRNRYQKVSVPQPVFEIVDNLEDFEIAAKGFSYPIVVKPADNSGSRGVSVVYEEKVLPDSYFAAIKNSLMGKVIIEEFMEGTELTVEGFSVNGEHHILAISDKYKPKGSFRVATQLAYPAAITSDQEKEVITLIKKALDAAEVDNTPTHSEVIMTKYGPKLVEIGCRGGGFYVFTRVVEAASGYDIVGNWTRLCAGDPVVEPKPIKRGVVLRFYAAAPGKLISVRGIEEAKAMKGVDTDLFLKPGDIVSDLKTDGSRTGWMIVRSANRDQAVAKADLVSKMVEFHTESLND
jgi:biotin carboxylase